MQLYRKLGVPVKKNNYTFSFATTARPRSPFLLYNGHSGLRGVSLPSQSLSLAALVAHVRLLVPLVVSYLALLALSLFHYVCGHLHDPGHALSIEPLQVWLDRHTRLIDPTFVDAILLSLFSAMTTSSRGRVQEVPVSEVMLYIAATFLRNHYTIQGGVQMAQAQLIAHIPPQHIHTAMAVHKVQAGQQATLTALHTHTQTYTNHPGFHDVIFATPANLSASLLDSYRASLDDAASAVLTQRIQGLRRELGDITYETSTVVNHTDRSLLPASRSDWRDLNLVSSPISSDKKGEGSTMATHVCHQTTDGQFVFQTTNPVVSPAPSSILSTSTFSRALTQSKRYQQGLFAWHRTGLFLPWKMQLGPLQRNQHNRIDGPDSRMPNLWFCGSYAQGIPLLEGCVTSSRLIVYEMLRQETC